MLDPTALYLGNPALLGDDRLRGLPMIVALSGYVEAGHLAGQIEAVVLDSMTGRRAPSTTRTPRATPPPRAGPACS